MDKKYLMSSAQKRMFIVNQLIEEDSTAYNMPFFYRLKKSVDRELLENALNKVIERHEILRSNFDIYKNKYVQIVHQNRQLKVEYKKIEKSEEEECRDFIRNFNLKKDCLLRARIVTCESGEALLMFDLHHIIFDGVSFDIFMKELNSIWQGEELNPVKVQYRQYSQWQIERNVEKQADYWRNEFADEIPVLDLRTDFERPLKQSFNGNEMAVQMDSELVGKILEYCKEKNITQFMFFISAFMLMLEKYTDQKEIVIGTPISGRNHTDVNDMLGMFVNTLAIKAEFNKLDSFDEFIEKVKEKCLKAYDNQDYQFEDLIDAVNPVRDMSRNPIFDLMFQMQNNKERGNLMLGDMELESIYIPRHLAKFDLTMTIVEAKEYAVNIEYCTDLFKADSIERMLKHYLILIENILKDTRKKISQISMIDEEEMKFVTSQFNQNDADYRKDVTISELFEEQVAKTPSNVALVFENQSLTYSELNEKANALAYKLRNTYKVGPNDFVAIISNRSIELVVAVYAVLKAGGAYVPIDPDYPAERISFMLGDCNPKVILKGTDEILTNSSIPVIDLFDENNYQDNKENLEPVANSDNLIYLIYTSGTTGNPKAVMISNKNLVRLIKNDHFQFDFNEKDVWTLFHSICFDFSVWELFASTLYGAKLVIVSKDKAKDTFEFADLLIREKVTVLNQVPTSFLNLMAVTANKKIDSLRYVIFGGEALKPSLLKDWKLANPDCRLINMYGITETTVHVTYCEIDDAVIESGISDIGNPIPTLSVYIINQDQICPIGIPGEICVAGDGLSRGYLNQYELTKEKFVANPFGNGLMYRSGDLGRRLPNGNIEYLGRIDNQVKIRGFRIETKEIEQKLCQIDSVKEAAVIVKTDNSAGKYLCAYIVSDENTDVNSIKEKLSLSLPEYMIPSFIVPINQMPTTRNGKIDIKALPEIEYSGLSQYIAPVNKKEQIILDIFKEVLETENISMTDSFFDLGGDSIKALRMSGRIREAGYRASVKAIMNGKTPKNIAKAAVKSLVFEEDEQGEITGEALLIPIQKEFLNSPLNNHNHFTQSLLYECSEKIDSDILINVIEKIVEHHDILRASFANGIQKIENYEEKKFYDFYEENVSKNQIDEKSLSIKQSMNLERGPLTKCALFHTEDKDYVLLAIHHILVDAVSFRILTEDLEKGYIQMKERKTISMPKKTLSYKSWGKILLDYTKTVQLKKEIPYWKKLEKALDNGRINKDGSMEKFCQKQLVLSLSEDLTKKLVNTENHPYNTSINDLLLAAVVRAVNAVTGQKTVSIELEGHGREEITDSVHLERTVGWFTSLYPVVFEKIGQNLDQDIRNIKETLRRVPANGIGYGILKCFDLIDATSERPDLTFNYLGEFTNSKFNDNTIFSISDVLHGSDHDKEDCFTAAVSINCALFNKCLNWDITYNEALYQQATMEKLKAAIEKEIENIVSFGSSLSLNEETASDFGELEWSDDEFRKIKAKLASNNLFIERIYPLTAMQNGMLYEKITDEESSQYVIQHVLVFDELDIESMHKAIDAVVSKYSILHTVIKYKFVSHPRQILVKERKPEFIYTLAEDEEDYLTIKNNDVKRGFDLEDDTLIRMTIVKVPNDGIHMILTHHHIIADGWSVSILYKDLFEYYASFHEGKEPKNIKNDNFEAFVRYIEDKDKDASLNYWEELIGDYDNTAIIPHFASADERNKEYNENKLVLSKEMTNKAIALSSKYGVTVNTLVEAIWGILLSKYNRSNDIVFGKVVSGRNAEVEDIDQMVGIFINTVPVRLRYELQDSYYSVLQKLMKQSLDTNEHDYCSLAEIQTRSQIGSRLVGTIMAFENYYVQDSDTFHEKNLSAKVESFREQISYDLGLSAYLNECLNLRIMYNTGLYGADEIELLLKHLKNLFEMALENPKERIASLKMTDDEEENLVTKQFNDSKCDYDKEKTIIDLFKEQIVKNPLNIALVYGDTELSYQALDELSNSLAHSLKNRYNIKKADIIAIISDRGIDMITAILAILKLGALYVPIDPTYPMSRIELMLADCQPKLTLLATNKVSDLEIDTLNILEESSFDKDKTEIVCEAKADDLAYIIYTSGTTGKPKGVMVENRGVNNLINIFTKEFKIDNSHTVGMFHNYIFDGSVWEMMMALLTGSKLVILSESEVHDVNELKSAIENQKIDILALPPQYAAKADITGIKMLITAGSQAPIELLSKIDDIYINSYGPTENTVSATYYQYRKGEPVPKKIPIGKPAPNVNIYILNQDELCGIGVPGEVCISGDGLARGYLNMPELTDEKFVNNPFGEGKLYRTGDLAAWMKDGNIDYLGRIDEQVKIRGYRVEIFEIQEKISKIEDISEAVVIARNDKGRDLYLCAYVVADEEVDANDIKNELRKTLPEYMIPSAIMQLDRIPLTRNGKLDKNALPAPEYVNTSEYVPASNSIEKDIIEAMEYVLGEEHIGMYDDFYSLGGHSILLIELVNILNDKFNVKFRILDFVESLTATDIYKKYLELKKEAEESDADWGEFIE